VHSALNLGLDIRIPPAYIADEHQRLRAYKRIADAKDTEQAAAFRAELEDRYGPPPEAVGTLFAFALVSMGVIILRRTQPDRPRGFRVPLVPWFPLISIGLCLVLMTGLTVITWIRFVVWLGIGLVIYLLYSRHHSEFARSR